ncbi:MAG TPA: adenylate/guanylate cyclase domain-containing protein [Gaiellaceae bacterium]|nr:adenylate/guanylate cyclase domain-containing protein [Gaiellaceae bacterium]
MTHETRFAKTADGVYLAYQAVGSGPVDVVMDFHAFAGNVDLIWDEPDWGPMLAKLTDFARLIIHDRRGSGASTRNAPPPNLETRAADLLTVLDAIGSERPVLGAGASTGAMHALFAATYPDRISGLVWNYPRPRLAWAPDYPWGQGPDAFEAALADARNWGTTEQAREHAQNRAAQRQGVPHDQRHTLAVDEDVVRRYARITRNTIGPDVAEALTRILWQTDVRDILPSVRTPTALIVGEADAQAERDEAEYVESLMPNATVHLLRGRSGLQVEEQMAIMRELAGIERRPAVSTVLATVLFTDIVDSTRKQAALGDRRWRELALAHHAAVRGALSHWDGSEHDTAGDGFFASFVGPARAIHCAHEIAARVADLGLETRAGVHIGECEVIDGKPGGLAVTIAARLLGTAGAREVVVTGTVKDLVAGSGFAFTDRGEHELKGVPDVWRIYLAERTRGEL